MSVLFKNLRFIRNGKISEPKNFFIHDQSFKELVDSSESEFKEIIDCSSYFASSGWIDLRCGLGEPGQEYRETVESLCQSLISSGFVKAVIMPNTDPVIQSKNEVDFVLNRSRKFGIDLEIMGAVTKNTLGEDLTEILDMHFQSGVKIFGDGIKPLSNSDRFMKILQYLQKFDGVLFDHAYDPLLSIFGQMHEGEISTQLGMKGIPNLSEDIAIQRNLEILRYTGGRVHFQTLSTKKGVELIRKAKAEGLNVTADTSIYQLIFKDKDLMTFDPNYKVNPPFRSESDRAALIDGILDGTIDALVSNHQPQDFDSKFSEFDLASFGMAGLQAFLPALVQLSQELSWEVLIEKITAGPSKIIGSQNESVTIFDPTQSWVYDEKSNKSLSSNHPWFGTSLTGQVKFVFQKGNLQRVNE
ncbi:dihydroorotase [Algoriphagus boseongensis]|uniref:Dihydroorotase n=1 Tax=Algoriphagus boseongensis TaxID=1442587 RepID=A0A4R6T1U1_9BACT|nr:dihydroorotase [Algoriphagus boseongensis]TDQ14922.1 dihydroorotase [Algoriphagus boseongensis]